MFIHVFVYLLIIQFIFSIWTSTNLNLINNFIFTFRCNHVTIWCPLYKPFSRLLWMVIIWRTYFLKWCMHIYPRIKTFANKRFRLMRGSNSSYICPKKMCSLFYFFHDFLWITITFIEYILPHSSFAPLRGAILILCVQHLFFHINILNAFFCLYDIHNKIDTQFCLKHFITWYNFFFQCEWIWLVNYVKVVLFPKYYVFRSDKT